jgi:hypothetical protein
VVGKKTLAAKQEAEAAQDSNLSSRFDAAVLKLAARQRMNTDVRRAIFCVLVTSEDYQDAFANLMKLQLKNKQDREIVHVLLHCCLQEKQYNEYYGLLADKLCNFDHNYKETFKYALWDKLKQVDELPSRSLVNLSSFYAKLMSTHAVSLSVLKVVDFESLSAKGVRPSSAFLASPRSRSYFLLILDRFLPTLVHKFVHCRSRDGRSGFQASGWTARLGQAQRWPHCLFHPIIHSKRHGEAASCHASGCVAPGSQGYEKLRSRIFLE